MIQAWIFDLDGTLVQTERLKAISYARAAIDLCPYEIIESQVLEAFKEVVGRSRREVAESLVAKFNLEEKARKQMKKFGVSTPWQVFIQIRLKHYKEMLADPSVIRESQWSHNVNLLHQVRKDHYKTALVTMSACEQATKVLQILDLRDEFDFIATRDDVDHGKPDPEIYRLALAELEVEPGESVAIEDSPTGVQAALAAGVNVIAVSTPFTHEKLLRGGLLPRSRIVEEPNQLASVVANLIQELEP